MNKLFVLDSSAVLAVINSEKGNENVEPKFPEAIVSTVNVAEVMGKLAERGVDLYSALNYFMNVGLEVVDFDASQALECGKLRPLTKHLGLSLGDRACLSLAIANNATAVTADRVWAKLDLCPIEIIR